MDTEEGDRGINTVKCRGLRQERDRKANDTGCLNVGLAG